MNGTQHRVKLLTICLLVALAVILTLALSAAPVLAGLAWCG